MHVQAASPDPMWNLPALFQSLLELARSDVPVAISVLAPLKKALN